MATDINDPQVTLLRQCGAATSCGGSMGGLRVYKGAGETDRRHLRGALVQTVSDYIFLPLIVVNLISSSVLGVTGPNFMLAHTSLWMLNSLSFVSSIQALFDIVRLSSVLLHRWQSCQLITASCVPEAVEP